MDTTSQSAKSTTRDAHTAHDSHTAHDAQTDHTARPAAHHITTERIYGSDADSQSFRILVDRLWPRGVSKVKAALDLWEKDVAPSSDLRTWFAHDPEKFPEFSRRYREELDANPAVEDFVATVRAELAHADVVLLYGAKDSEHNQAVVLKDYLQQKL